MDKKKRAAPALPGMVLLALLLFAALFALRHSFIGPDTAAVLLLLGGVAALWAWACVLVYRAGRERARVRHMVEWLTRANVDSYIEDGRISGEVPREVRGALEHLLRVLETQYAAKIMEKQIAFDSLQHQINPHFLYNTLEAIRSQALLNEQTAIAAMTEHLARFFRYCISNQEDCVTLREELANAKDYFYIQQYRFEDRFALCVTGVEDRVMESLIPKMTFQPLLENAIYHGLEPQKGKGSLTIDFAASDDMIQVSVRDDGVGMDEGAVRELNDRFRRPFAGRGREGEGRAGTGMALGNVHARIQLYFGPEYGLRVRSAPGRGTEVEMTIPYVDSLNRTQYLQ